MHQTLSVGELTEQIKNLLESTFVHVVVEGELSRITYHGSGHIYFTLKDDTAVMPCVMFRGNAASLRFRLEEGMRVVINGAVTLYKPHGKYQLRAFSIAPAGEGALSLAFEQLKKELASSGYFDASRKKPLPKFPKRIALITSATSAALQDMLRIANQRYRLVRIDIYDTLVQGEGAAQSIAKAIAKADGKGYDVLIVGRGGGSLEDLWAFNERIVADAIFAAKTPVVSAVGHEIDTLISDFVADVRAPTPSAAMQIVLPDMYEILQGIDTLHERIDAAFTQVLQRKAQEMRHLYERFQTHSIEQRIEQSMQMLSSLRAEFLRAVRHKIDYCGTQIAPLRNALERETAQALRHKERTLIELQNAYKSADPKRKRKKGFVQIVKEGRVAGLDELKTGDTIELNDALYKAEATVTHIAKN